MRGKNILWLSLIAMLFGVMMVNIGIGAPATKLYVDPPLVKDEAPCEFTVDVKVSTISGLFAYGMTVDYKPYAQVLVASIVTEGPFLKQAGTTYFKAVISPFYGTIKVGCTILGASAGASGSGTLFSIKFKAVEAGESQIDLLDSILLNNALQEIAHQVGNGYYNGYTTELLSLGVTGRWLYPGDTQIFQTTVHNFGHSYDMYAKVLITMVRDDGRELQLWAGQSYIFPPAREPEYLYVDGYTAERQQWNEFGTGPFLDAPDDGNYIEGSYPAAQHRWFTFEDIALAGAVIDRVTLEGYTNGPFSYDTDYDVYSGNFDWLGSLYGAGEPAWVSPRWTTDAVSDIDPSVLTETGLNAFKIMMYAYGPQDATDIVDCVRLKVVFKEPLERVLSPPIAPVFGPIAPGADFYCDPSAFDMLAEDVGRYYVEAVCYMTQQGWAWVEGEKTKTSWFVVSPLPEG